MQQPVQAELIIRKSRFIGCVQPVSGRPAALQVLAQLRAQHPDAAHVCWAMLAGGDSAANDDGEPSGTAGRPMLEVLRRQQLDGVLATVVRYFGGIKLGAGGLVRAYTDAVAQPLLDAVKVPLRREVVLRVEGPYALEGLVRRQLASHGASLLDASHGASVSFVFSAQEDAAALIRKTLDEAGQGQLRWPEPPLTP